MVYTALPYTVELPHGRSNRILCRLWVNMNVEEIFPTFVSLNIYIGLRLPEALTVRQLSLYNIFEELLIIRINTCGGLQ